MNNLFRPVAGLLFLFLSVAVQAQAPQELIDKAKAAGMSDAQIQQEITKYNNQSEQSQRVRTAAEAADSDRSWQVPTEQVEMEEPPVEDLSGVVFGREIFTNKQLSFSPDLNIPTPKSYRLSAGDELLINVWGDSEMNLKQKISPEGIIQIPNLGPVGISGLTVEQAEEHLRKELGRIMTSLTMQEEAKTFVSVSLSQIRSIKVNMVGELVSPGTYTLPSFATLFNALYAAGGVNDIGSLRSIKVFRDSKLVAELDVYDYLLNGKYDTNVRLEENDMVMVGAYDQHVAVRGKVKRNRIFELKKGETLEQLLNMAGGFTGDAYTKDVRVNRKSETRYEIATVPNGQFASFVMRDGDELTVDEIVGMYENRLVVSGAVWRPGEYELNASVHTVKQLVAQAAGLKGDEFAGRAQITRLNPDFTQTLIAVDIRGILNGSVPDMELRAEDHLSIPSLFDLREPYMVKVLGAVNKPQEALPFQQNMTIEDAVILAGGLREAAATVRIEVSRRMRNPVSEQTSSRRAEMFSFTLDENLRVAHGEQVFVLEPFDEVYVRFSPGYEEQQVVTISGEVLFSGDYVLEKKNMRLSEVVTKAGGVTPEAYVKGASLRRKLSEDELRRIETLLEMSANKDGRDSVPLSSLTLNDYSVGIDLVKALEKPGSVHDVVLRDGDELYIPQRQSTVKISGAVVYPNSVTYISGMSVKEALNQAGGYSDLSRKYPVVIYMNGKVATTKKKFLHKSYPKLEPGCEVVVPMKSLDARQKMGLMEILSITNSATSMAAMITSIVRMLDNN